MSLKDISPDNELPEDINLPYQLALAFGADRPELCRLWKGPMDATTAEAVAHAFGMLMAKNRHLRQKLTRMRKAIEDGLAGARGQLNAMAGKVIAEDVDAPRSLVDMGEGRDDED